jgi:hypothetical protein
MSSNTTTAPAHAHETVPTVTSDVVTVQGLGGLYPDGDDPHHVDLLAECNGTKWRICLISPSHGECAYFLYKQTAHGEEREDDCGELFSITLKEAATVALCAAVEASYPKD